MDCTILTIIIIIWLKALIQAQLFFQNAIHHTFTTTDGVMNRGSIFLLLLPSFFTFKHSFWRKKNINKRAVGFELILPLLGLKLSRNVAISIIDPQIELRFQTSSCYIRRNPRRWCLRYNSQRGRCTTVPRSWCMCTLLHNWRVTSVTLMKTTHRHFEKPAQALIA